MRRPPAALVRGLLALALARPALAQQPPRFGAQRPVVPESVRVVLVTRLGGDSATATTVALRRGWTYRVEVRPAAADVQLRRLVRDGSSVPPLPPLQLAPGESVPGARAFRVVARERGDHMVALTNPGVGTTSVRIVQMLLTARDTLAVTERRRLLFTENFSAGSVIVSLDSGHVYYVVSGSAVSIAPRSGARDPVQLAPLVRGGGSGAAFVPASTGEYVLEGTGSVQVYENEQVVERVPGGASLGLVMVLVAFPLMVLVDVMFR